MSDEVPRRAHARPNIESLRKEAKQWLRTLHGPREDSATQAAIGRLRAALESALQKSALTEKRPPVRARNSATAHQSTKRQPTAHESTTHEPTTPHPTLRDVQLALARELGFAGWADLKQSLSTNAAQATRTLQQFEAKAEALLDAYRSGTPDALERHYSLTWHRRSWSAMRTYIQLDLGKRPAHDGDDVEITIEDARELIAVEHDFESWDELRAFFANQPAGDVVTASPMHVASSNDEDLRPLISSREWARVLDILAAHPNAVLDANGQMTDNMLAQVARIPHLTVLKLGHSQQLTDEGVRHLAGMPQLRELDLSHTRVTDDALKVLRNLPALRSLNLMMTMVTDDGLAHLESCHELERLHLMWTMTGDGAMRAVAGKQHFTHLWSGNNVTDEGLALLHELPAVRRWRGGETSFGLLQKDVSPNQLSLRGRITDRGVAQLRGLDGLCVLHLDDVALSDAAGALEPLTALPHLEKLGVDPKNAWMPAIARMPALRFLSIQDAQVNETAYETLSQSQTIEYLWGRRSYGVGARAFRALATMPSLRGLSVSCKNVSDHTLALLPEFSALRELMPIDIADAGYRHIGKCANLQALLLMYCRETTDAATEQIGGLGQLRRYFNSYTTITDHTPQALSGMDSLETITFDACNNLTNQGVASLARLPNLNELRVSGKLLTPAVQNSFGSRVKVYYSP